MSDLHKSERHSSFGVGEERVHTDCGTAEEHGGSGRSLQPTEHLLGRPGSQSHIQVEHRLHMMHIL